jgi:hypothetical protein
MSELDALQTALAAEHATVHVLGALGSRTSASASPGLFRALSDAFTTHRARRDQLSRWIRDDGATPVASEPAYRLPPAVGPDAVTRAALDLERSCAESYAWLVAHTTGTRRRWAVQALTNAAVRELTFRGSPEIFPGAGEHADR